MFADDVLTDGLAQEQLREEEIVVIKLGLRNAPSWAAADAAATVVRRVEHFESSNDRRLWNDYSRMQREVRSDGRGRVGEMQLASNSGFGEAVRDILVMAY